MGLMKKMVHKQPCSFLGSPPTPSSFLDALLFNLEKHLQQKHVYRSCLIALVSFAFLLRAMLSRFPHSGKNNPPIFGDFEAQRHWLEVTLHLPIQQWYLYDGGYWRLDYPPLTAYVSWIFGKIAHFINPDWVALATSRGIESNGLIAYMRSTVLFSDVVLYFPSIFFFVHSTMSSFSPALKLSTLAQLLFFPPLLFMDHSHFQYNLVMLSFFVLSITWMFRGQYIPSAIAFSLSLLFKQMALYFALPIFFYLLCQCIHRKRNGLLLFFQLGITVISVFALLLFPFRNHLLELLHRVFPVQRGIFEDKVASFWCTFNPLFKFRDRFSASTLFIASLFSTLAASLPSLFGLFHHPNLFSLLHASVAVAMSFFLFSFHVHEKTILLPLMPLLLVMPFTHSSTSFSSFVGPWMISLSTFSLFPLLKREHAELAYYSIQCLYFVVFMPQARLSKLLFLFFVLFHAAEYLIAPPARYPDLWPVLNLSVSFAFFACTWAFSTYMSIFK